MRTGMSGSPVGDEVVALSEVRHFERMSGRFRSECARRAPSHQRGGSSGLRDLT